MTDNLKEREAFEAWFAPYWNGPQSDLAAWSGWKARAAIDAALAARGAVPAGWVMVPAEPTDTMAFAADEHCSAGTAKRCYLAMLAASPQQITQPSEVVEAAEEHPTNNHLFKVMCERAGIVLGVDRVDVALEKIDRLFASAKPEQAAQPAEQQRDELILTLQKMKAKLHIDDPLDMYDDVCAALKIGGAR